MRVDALTHIHTHIHIHRTHKSVHGLEADRKAKKEARSRGGAKPEVRLESWMEKALPTKELSAEEGEGSDISFHIWKNPVTSLPLCLLVARGPEASTYTIICIPATARMNMDVDARPCRTEISPRCSCSEFPPRKRPSASIVRDWLSLKQKQWLERKKERKSVNRKVQLLLYIIIRSRMGNSTKEL